MAVVYSIAVRNARLQVVVDAIGALGRLKVYTAGPGTLLCSIPLATPCGTIAGGILTFTTPQVDFSAAASGNAAEGQLTDSIGTVVVSGLTIGLAGTDFIISPTASIQIGTPVTFVRGQIVGN